MLRAIEAFDVFEWNSLGHDYVFWSFRIAFLDEFDQKRFDICR